MKKTIERISKETVTVCDICGREAHYCAPRARINDVGPVMLCLGTSTFATLGLCKKDICTTCYTKALNETIEKLFSDKKK